MKFLINKGQEIEITKEDFEDYERVRSGGLTNMFMIKDVIALSNNLDKDKCLTIMDNYAELMKEFPGVRK